LLAGVVTPVYLSLQASNSLAFAAHQALPHIVVVSLFLFIFPGGAGATMPLALMLAFSKVPRLRRIGRACVPFALINANEPLLLSLPIVMNPYLAVPFVLAPMLLATTTYACVALGWVARAAFYIPSSIPAPISVYLATLDWRAPLLLLVNLAIAAAIWRPFVQAYERAESRLA
ncbi:MAG TPA: PTS transporter subunit EIIC, partial [Candidatus Dormibacteraeota bacterium]|nr:PTS transporter subunit EIIC [Candidatus Dormibacteraeota bacterium]